MSNDSKIISLDEIKKLIDLNHSVSIYPNKKIISVDGFKKYNASEYVINETKKLLKTKRYFI